MCRGSPGIDPLALLQEARQYFPAERSREGLQPVVSWQRSGKNLSTSGNESEGRISLFKQRRGKKQVDP